MRRRKHDRATEPEVHTLLRPMKEGYYRSVANDPDQWFKTAQSLWSAAELIWLKVRESYQMLPDVQAFRDGTCATGDNLRRLEESNRLERCYAGPAFLLSAYAIENVLKALLVKHQLNDNAPPISNGSTKLSDAFKTHDLKMLAEKVSFPGTPKDSDLLDRLARYALWEGRYPVDLWIDWPEIGTGGRSSNDADDVAHLYTRLTEFYNGSYRRCHE